MMPVNDVLQISVQCYSGYRGEQTPRTIIFGDEHVEIAEVLDQWLAPDHRYFKLRDVDGHTYIIRHDEARDAWELTMYKR